MAAPDWQGERAGPEVRWMEGWANCVGARLEATEGEGDRGGTEGVKSGFMNRAGSPCSHAT